MRKYSWLFGLALLLTAAVSAGVATVINQQFFNKVALVEQVPQRNAQFVKTNASPQVAGAVVPESFANTAAITLPAVVNITALSGSGYQESGGSGVIISSDGYIATNYHVVEDGASFKVSLDNKRDYRAEVIGVDPTTDLALIKIDAEGLPALRFGDSDRARVGEWVLAVGNPFDLTSTVTAGIISAKGRDIDIIGGQSPIEAFIQTDAAVNPGNSGGALVTASGELLGMNTAISTRTGSFEGYSFAIPIDLLANIADEIIRTGNYQRASLGIDAYDLDTEAAAELGVDFTRGVVVMSVLPNSAASAAGLRRHDIIVGVDGEAVNSAPQLQQLVNRRKVGERTTVTVIRAGRELTLPFTLGAG